MNKIKGISLSLLSSLVLGSEVLSANNNINEDVVRCVRINKDLQSLLIFGEVYEKYPSYMIDEEKLILVVQDYLEKIDGILVKKCSEDIIKEK